MIEPTKISPLNTTKHTLFNCSSCGFNGEIYWENRVINTDREADIAELNNEPRPKCGIALGKKSFNNKKQ